MRSALTWPASKQERDRIGPGLGHAGQGVGRPGAGRGADDHARLGAFRMRKSTRDEFLSLVGHRL